MESIMDKENHFITISKVVARDLKFAVLEKLESSPYASPTKIAEDEGEGHIPSKKSNVEDAWIELLKNPSSYWDNRDFKKSLKSPDFKHKATSLGLWISNTNTPPWVHDWLCSRRLYASIKDPGRLWEEFFACPEDWWDQRTCKKYSGGPDFRNKISGDALWIKSPRTPEWVERQLELHDAKKLSP
ncbi:hypothetical protein KP509_14G059500 [Ceratopteris richardii]|nr:hypothetical protein KP509_14G059500 [Ceratopteris richardii]